MQGDEKREVLKSFNHRLNNDLQALLALIKLKKRFEIDDGEIIDFTCVSIASISAIQNQMYYSDDENLISAAEFFDGFKKILTDQYIKSGIEFSSEIESDLKMDPKKMFHLMLLVNELVTFDSTSNIRFSLEKIDDECLLKYSGLKEKISGVRNILFEELVKQIDGHVESVGNDSVSIKFKQ